MASFVASPSIFQLMPENTARCRLFSRKYTKKKVSLIKEENESPNSMKTAESTFYNSSEVLKDRINYWYGVEYMPAPQPKPQEKKTSNQVLEHIFNQFNAKLYSFSVNSVASAETALKKVPDLIQKNCNDLLKTLTVIYDAGNIVEDDGSSSMSDVKQHKLMLNHLELFCREKPNDCGLSTHAEAVKGLKGNLLSNFFKAFGLVLTASVENRDPEMAQDLTRGKDGLHRIWTEFYRALINVAIGGSYILPYKANEQEFLERQICIKYHGICTFHLNPKNDRILVKPDLVVAVSDIKNDHRSSLILFVVEVETSVSVMISDEQRSTSEHDTVSANGDTKSSSQAHSKTKGRFYSDLKTKVKTQHFLELLGLMSLPCMGDYGYFFQEKSFGLYMAMDQVIPTMLCVRKKNDDKYEALNKRALTEKLSYHCFLRNLGSTMFTSKPEDKYNLEMLIATPLNIFDIEHVKALISYIQILAFHECNESLVKMFN